MKTGSNCSNLLLCCGLMIGAGAANGRDQSFGGPMYAGKPLSIWVDEVVAHHGQAVNTNYAEVRAVHTIGTNAIPWLLSEMTNQPPSGTGDDRPNVHQIRAAVGLWALSEAGAPAIPKLLELVDEQPEFVPRALAGIGFPGLTALQQCLTNAPHYVPPNLLKKNSTRTRCRKRSGCAVRLGRSWAYYEARSRASITRRSPLGQGHKSGSSLLGCWSSPRTGGGTMKPSIPSRFHAPGT